MLGTWEVVKLDTNKELTENAVSIDFIKGSKNQVNLFYLYLPNGKKYEGQWRFYKDGTFYMKFHEGGYGVSYEDIIFSEDKGDYNLSANQFNLKGTFRHFISSDKHEDNYCSIVLKR